MSKEKAKPPAKIKGYVYHQNKGKVNWTRAEWEGFLSTFEQVKIESVEGIDDDDKDYLISARFPIDKERTQRNLIAESYSKHPTRG